MGPNPFGGNPFMGSSPFGSLPKFLDDEKEDVISKGNDSFNIDDLVKKIDAKIAEIEKEEEENKNKNDSVSIKDLIPNKPIENNSEEHPNNVIEIDNKETNKKETETMYEDNTADDDFFDDFFSDD